jgi:hypothetical protein
MRISALRICFAVLLLLLCSIAAYAGLVVGWPYSAYLSGGRTQIYLKAANTDWVGSRTFTRIIIQYNYAADQSKGWGDAGRVVYGPITLTGGTDPRSREIPLLVVTTLPRRPPGPATIQMTAEWDEEGQQTQANNFVLHF